MSAVALVALVAAYAAGGALTYRLTYRVLERYNPGGFERDRARKLRLALSATLWPGVALVWLLGQTKPGNAWLEREVHRMELADPVRAAEEEQRRLQARREREEDR